MTTAPAARPAESKRRFRRFNVGALPPLLGFLETAALLVVAFVIWHFFNQNTVAQHLLVPVLLLSFIPYFIAVYVCADARSQTTTRAILFFAMVFRLIFWGTAPVLSDDIDRYVWEGRIQHHGFNPYALAPNSPELKPLRDEGYQHVNHADVSAIYPPFAELLFRVLTWLPHPLACMKFFFGGIDLLNVWLLICILRARGQPYQYALIYAWNPLPAIEFAGSGHFLSVAICLFLAAYHALQRDRQIVAAVAAGFAIGTQFLILAPLIHIYNAMQKRWFPIVPLVVALLYVPYLSAESRLWNGLTQYGAMWKFNDSLFGVLIRVFDHPRWVSLGNGVYLAFQRPKIIAAAILVAIGLWFIFKTRDWLRAGYWMTGTVLLLSPTVHPWYATLILPFLCFYRNHGWLVFSALVTIAYSAIVVFQQTGIWPTITLFPTHEGIEVSGLAWLEYGPFFALLAWGCLRRPYDPLAENPHRE